MRTRLIDALILSGAMLYILLGVSMTSLHGDELTQIFMARDSYLMAHGDWDQLPYKVLSPMNNLLYLRLINGTVNKTLIGYVWMAEGREAFELPGLYDWNRTYSFNRAFGNVPSVTDIIVSRWPSAVFTALAVIPLFLLMRQLRCSRPISYFAVALYTLHPVILLNGRRAVMEGSLMFGTLATICWLVVVMKIERPDADQAARSRVWQWLRYALLGLLAGFTVSAKFSGVFVAAAVLVAIIAQGLLHNDARRLLLSLGITLIGMLSIWTVLNPAYWNDPVATTGEMLRERAFLLASQTHSSSLRYKNVWQRIDSVFVEPYLAPPQYYELPTWSYLVNDQIVAYKASPLSGINPGAAGNVILTLLAGLGLSVLVYEGRKMQPIALVMLSWAALTLIESLSIPLGWQRYYLPLTLITVVLSSIGAERLLWAIRASQQPKVIIAYVERQVHETFDSA